MWDTFFAPSAVSRLFLALRNLVAYAYATKFRRAVAAIIDGIRKSVLDKKASPAGVARRMVIAVRYWCAADDQSMFTELNLHSRQQREMRPREFTYRRRHLLNPKTPDLGAALA